MSLLDLVSELSISLSIYFNIPLLAWKMSSDNVFDDLFDIIAGALYGRVYVCIFPMPRFIMNIRE
jgi:hypothetical protein